MRNPHKLIDEKIENLRRDIWGCEGATEPLRSIADILSELNAAIRALSPPSPVETMENEGGE